MKKRLSDSELKRKIGKWKQQAFGPNSREAVPHRSSLRKGRMSLPGCAYFITKCVEDYDTKVLARPGCAGIVIESLEWLANENIAHICGLVVMPNHYHTVVGLGEVKSLQGIMESIGKYTARRINRILGRSGSFWEEGFHDHLIRDRQDFEDILLYMHYNPVRAGLVEGPELWQFSTANPKYAHLIDWEWLGHALPDAQERRRK